jgi:uncharacterized protein (TIGR00251 family)
MNPGGIERALRDRSDGCTLAVRVQPGAKRTGITGTYSDGEQTALKIALQAAPIEGRANDALLAFLAQALGLPKTSVEILSGQSSRSKVCFLRAVSAVQAASLLEKLLTKPF